MQYLFDREQTQRNEVLLDWKIVRESCEWFEQVGIRRKLKQRFSDIYRTIVTCNTIYDITFIIV